MAGLIVIYIDGLLEQRVDLFSPDTGLQTVFEKSGLKDGNHTLKVVLADSRNVLSTGNCFVLDVIRYESNVTE